VSIKKYLPHILLALLVFTVIVGNFCWLKSTDLVLPFASAETGLDFYIGATEGVSNLFEGISNITEKLAGCTYYPPLHFLLIMFYHLIFGPEKFVPMAVNATCLIIALFSIYMLCKKISGPKSGLLAVFITITCPAIFIMARTDLTEYVLFSLVALTLYLFIYTQNFYNRKYSVLLGVVLGLGMLTKWTYPVYISGAFFVFVILMFRKGLEKKQLKNLILSASIAIIISAFWYLGRLDIKFFFSTISGEASQISLSERIGYFANALKLYISLPYTIVFVAAILAFIINIKRDVSIFFVLILVFIVPYGFFSSVPHVEYRYLLPVIPSISCLASLGVSKILHNFVRIVLISVIASIGLFNLVFYFQKIPALSGFFQDIPLTKLQYESKMFDNIINVINGDSDGPEIFMAASPFNGPEDCYVSLSPMTYRLTLDHLKRRNQNISIKGFALNDFMGFAYKLDYVDFLIVTRPALEDDKRSNEMRALIRESRNFKYIYGKELYMDDPSYRMLIEDKFALLKEIPSRLDSNVLIYKNKKLISGKE